ncbi:CHAT domain-containing protein [Erythrobacter sp. EC-HK427]|uniref:CHAT domain-containing protein n=1 Tax=Erythrobacter sp. EC-HK427 TaxID=2038396 RepID=UPI00125ACB04|nr:CHAT domain-containing protein [Erythrobacter sp. EC-HK427]VVT18035.1 CHAT domain-containing protein [Erythrobacter sp. EC-HK427]
MIMRPAKSTLFAAVSAMAVLMTQPAAARPDTPEVFALGENTQGDVCTASLRWPDSDELVRFAGDQPYGINCRGIDAAQLQGYISGAQTRDTSGCSTSVETQMLAGLGQVDIRKCFDPQLQRVAYDLRFERNGRLWQGAAIEAALPNLEAALRVLVNNETAPEGGTTPQGSIDLSNLRQIELAGQGEGNEAGGVNTADAVFTSGVRALQTGRLLDASRILNDALREFADADAATLIDLRMAAGLADSNVSQFEAADLHFAAAEALLDAQGNEANAEQQEQLRVYRGLHLINQRQWDRAIQVLNVATTTDGQLLDPVVLSRLNQETLTFGAAAEDAGAGDLQSSLGDEAGLQSVLLEAQRYWTLSVAQLANAGQPGRDRTEGEAAAEVSIRNAAAVAAAPIARIEPARIGWLHSAIERQQGRIHVRRGDIAAAVASFDCAIAALRGAVPANSSACLVRPIQRGADLAATSALLLETQLERASVASRDPSRRNDALEDYRSAISGIANLDGVGPVSQAALERYFDLLSESTPTEARSAEFFRAMQAIGEPAIAREYATMQQELSQDDTIRQLLRERRDLQQERNGLTFAIGALAGEQGGGERTTLESELRDVVARLDDVNSRIAETGGIAQLDDEPIDLETLRSVLEPGEVYFKLVELNDAVYAMVVSREEASFHRVEGTLDEVTRAADAVLSSAQSRYRPERDDVGTIPFDIRGAYEVFARITGPAAGLVANSDSVIFDAAGIFRQFPIAMLVTDEASVLEYERFPEERGRYDRAQFLVESAQTTVALSPRAFLSSRIERRPSEAEFDIFGFANAPVPQLSAAQGNAAMPLECRVTLQAWANYIYAADPVSADELRLIANALGRDNVPQLTGDAFTEEALLGDNPAVDLSNYSILHFATHGLPGQLVRASEDDECLAYVPPALITALAAPVNGEVAGDGLLSFDEVTRLDLDANLVVLSACETSAAAAALAARQAGFETSGAELDGLVRSFLVADARAVMATFWRVPENANTLKIMQDFYVAGQSETISTSLQTAQLAALRNLLSSHPYHWANFFIVGDGANNMYARAGADEGS